MTAPKQFYLIKLSMSQSEHQTALINAFKNNGDDVIQCSSGLCVKTAHSEDEVNSKLKDLEIDQGVSLEPISAKSKDLEQLSPDVVAFIKGDTP